MSTPLFSVLVANYNNGKYITDCLDSILKQDYPNIEIVVVDDASIDNSIALIDKYSANNAKIKLHQNIKNEGVGYTKKRCIDEAKGEILGFVDPDDVITPDAVSKMVAMHRSYPQASLIYSDYYECNECLKITGEYKSAQIVNGSTFFFNNEGKIGHFATLKKSVYLQTKGLNAYLRRAIDQDLYLKLYDVGDCIHVPQSLYYYRIHDEGLSTKAQTDLAYYWFWVVKILRAQEKGINLEKDFVNTFVRIERLKTWIKIDTMFRKSPIYKLLKFFK